MPEHGYTISSHMSLGSGELKNVPVTANFIKLSVSLRRSLEEPDQEVLCFRNTH